MKRVCGAPSPPNPRWNRTLAPDYEKPGSIGKYYLPGDPEQQIGAFVRHYDNERYHESLRHLSEDARVLLGDRFTAPDDQNRYRLTLLKKLSQSTRPTEIKESVADFDILLDLHDQLGSILSKLDLSTAGIQYFAGSVLPSEIFQMQRRDRNDRYIHAAAFAAHQFYRCHGNMIDL